MWVVKIGVSDSPRELVFSSSDSPDVVEHEIKTAWPWRGAEPDR